MSRDPRGQEQQPGPEQLSLLAPGPSAGPPQPLLGAVELSRRLGQRHAPTAEQARAIEHARVDDAGRVRLAPYLVVAGAGSGKTETMAARVVWLVANGLVRPERVLGLTFTRKAAGELAERIRVRLAQLGRSGITVPEQGEDLAGEPVVSTYHSYASGLVGEHALRLGREPSVRLLGEAQTWQLAGRVAAGYDGDLSAVEWGPAKVVGVVRALAGELAEHLVSPAELAALCRETAELVEKLPRGRKKGAGDRYAETTAFLQVLRRREQLLPLVEAYERRKHELEAMDYGDQVALAARAASEHPEVGALERGRYDVVLLDEYQDTGTAQRVLLRALFGGGHPVTAVGDPCQSIYGWRGASAGNLRRFPHDFPEQAPVAGARHGNASAHPADVVALTTSFRNGGRILAVANSLSAELRREGVPVADLHPLPGAEDAGAVRTALLPDAEGEAEWIADRVEEVLAPRGPYAPRDVAVLARTRSQFGRLEHALRARGIPVEVSGLGGLLSTPEVADAVATLAVLADVTAGAALLRLLTGARWRLGPRDLDALARRALVLAGPFPGGGDSGGPVEPDDAERMSIVEALDDLGDPAAYSAEGYRRLRALAEELRGLRRRADQPLPDLVQDVVRTSRLDIEVVVRGGPVGRGHLDRFADVAAEFAASEEAPSIPSFLAYLEAAEEYERGLDLGRAGVPGDAVSLLTVHAAKGLEWPVVVLPGLVDKVFPSRGQGGSDWSTRAELLPSPLRGDCDDLPLLDLLPCEDQYDVREALRAHGEACKARDLLEERRLAYVAATRARDVLLCSGYVWDHTRNPRTPSPFLLEVRETCVRLGTLRADEPPADDPWTPAPADGETNPAPAVAAEGVWPLDPLPPDARAALDDAARAVEAARGALAPRPAAEASRAALGPAAVEASSATPSDRAAEAGALGGEGSTGRAAAWADEVDRLLAERRRIAGDQGAVEVPLPGHLSVSQLVRLRRDPDELARWLRRPVPLPPAPLARRGTAFHGWLEQRFGAQRLLDVDELPGAADAGAAADADLAELKERFLASEWADRRPVEVEVPFETLVEGVLVRGRMDAVFRDADGGWEVVDWKTGRRPTGAEAEAAAVQLAAYRLAWHRLAGVPLSAVRAAFHYVRSGETVRPVDLLDAAGLAGLVRAVPVAQSAEDRWRSGDRRGSSNGGGVRPGRGPRP